MDHGPGRDLRSRISPRTRVCGRARLTGSDGFSLLELIVGMTIGAAMIFAISGSLASAIGATSTTRTTVQASLLASERVEEIRGIGWGDTLGHLPGSLVSEPAVVAGRFDPDDAGPLLSEPIIENVAGALTTHVRVTTFQGVRFVTKAFITGASTARRATVVVTWTEGRRAHTVRSSTLLGPRSTTLIGGSAGGGTVLAAAYIVSGSIPSVGTIATVGAVTAPPDASADLASFSPAVEITGTGAHTEAQANAVIHHARAEIGSLAASLPGLSVLGSSVIADINWSTPGAPPTMTCTASFTVNGVTYVNPGPDTVITAGAWRVVLNAQRLEADGSRTITALRITGLGAELTVGYAWARPS